MRTDSSKNNAFHNCIAKARMSRPGEAALYYRLAVMLDPFSEEGYLGLISCLEEDGGSIRGVSHLLNDAFYSAEYDRKLKNIDNLKANQEGYARVIAAAAGFGSEAAKEYKTKKDCCTVSIQQP